MEINDNVTHVVLTGGVGSRLWPLSRKSQPKQYLELFDGHSLFEKTVVRNIKETNKLIVVGNIENYEIPQFQKQQGFNDTDKVKLLVTKFMKQEERYGALVSGIIDRNVRYVNIRLYDWDEFAILKSIYPM